MPESNAHAPDPQGQPRPAPAPGPARASSPPDLRRRDARSNAEELAWQARHLPRHERLLITAVYAEGRSIAELAASSGRHPRSLRREIRRVVQRLGAPEFAYVVGNLERLPGTMGRVARCCIVEGIPVRQAAALLRLSLHTVRKHREMVRILALTAQATGAGRSRAG